MKRISSLFLFALLLAAASCSAGESYANDIEDAQKPYDDVEISVLPNRADVVVTIKRDDAGVVFFQYGSDRLFPGEGYPFDGQCRAIGAVTIYAEEVSTGSNRSTAVISFSIPRKPWEPTAWTSLPIPG